MRTAVTRVPEELGEIGAVSGSGSAGYLGSR